VLTPRQLEVLSLYAVGKTHVEIGSELFISQNTVMTHLRDAREALGAENSTHAVTLCVARGLLCIDRRTESAYVPRPIDAEPSVEDYDLGYSH
jgi:DNA-binding CsgD family transcriptional regulator